MKNNQSGPVNRSTWEADLHGGIPRQNQVKEAMGFHNSENRASRKSREMASTRAHGLRSQPGPRAGMLSMGLASCPCHPPGPCTLLPRLFNALIPPCFQPQHPLSAVTFPQHRTFSASTVLEVRYLNLPFKASYTLAPSWSPSQIPLAAWHLTCKPP